MLEFIRMKVFIFSGLLIFVSCSHGECRLATDHGNGVSAELDVSPGLELTRMSPEEIQGATMPYG